MPSLNKLYELQNVFKNQTPSSAAWFQVIDMVVTELLEIEIERITASVDDKHGDA